MTLSIVIPAYNAREDLGNTLEDLLKQSYKDMQVIVVDDCATDETGEIADSYQQRFIEQGIAYQVVHKEKNQGLSMARNTGMELATGDYILFLDADDVLEHTLLETIAKEVKRQRVDLVIYGYTEDYYTKNVLEYQVKKQPVRHAFGKGKKETMADGYAYLCDLEAQTMFGYAWNKAYRLEFLREHHLTFETVTHIEDVLFNLKVAQYMESFLTLPDMLYHYCNRGQERLTAKYLPDYFALQKRRYTAFLNLQKEKMAQEKLLSKEQMRGWEAKVKQTMAAAYFRSFQSFLVREISHGTKKEKILAQGQEEIRGQLFEELHQWLMPESRVATILYAPLAKGKVAQAYRRSRLICTVQKKMPGLFAKLKQNR